MKEKYIELLLKRCLKVSSDTPLFINYNTLIKDFVDEVVSFAKTLGVQDIYLAEEDEYYIHDFLKDANVEEIKNSKLFDCSIWDEYAKKNAAFLMLDSEIPALMDDIEADKIAESSNIKRTTKPVYKEKQLKSEIPWCIACVPNEPWAKDLFPDSENPVEDFWNVLSKICMFDEGNPIQRWDEYLDKQEKLKNKLNDLKINKLYYKNSLGTNLEVTLNEKALWCSASSGEWIVNVPSYEVFTSPDFHYTNGVVYSSKPLIYNGQKIDDFHVKFKNGKVVDYDAKEGKETLKQIIESDKNACYLGEVALVNFDSPISNTNIVFKSTLIDENASCHVALGSGFLECIEDGNNLSKDELKKIGLNMSENHVDFMIGTDDLTIEADTIDGKVTIMKDGNIVI